MTRYFFSNLNFAHENRSGGLSFSGILLILIGLTIIIFPEILIAFIASLFMGGGAILLYFGWKLRKLQKNVIEININQNV
jgi:hypothetical protein